MPLRITKFDPAPSLQNVQATMPLASSASASGYGPPTTAASRKTGRFSGRSVIQQTSS